MAQTTIRAMRGLTAEEYATLQTAVKALPFKATVRIHRQQYCYGAVDIRPLKQNGWRFTDEQVEALRDLAAQYGLDDRSQTISRRAEWDTCCLWAGLNYLQKVVSIV